MAGSLGAAALDLARAAVSRAVYVTEAELSEHGRRLLGRDGWEFRPIGAVQSADGGRRWLLVRPGIERPLGQGGRRLVLVFDLNGVLGAKLFDAGGRLRPGRHCHARTGPLAFVLRPGAAKLLRMCEAAGHEVWIWSTMQRPTVEAFGRAAAPWLPPGRLLCAEDCSGSGDGWSPSEAKGSGWTPSEAKGSGPILKDLRRVWAASSLGGPDVAARTLLLDDDASKGRLQPECVVEVPEFSAEGPYDEAVVSDRGAGFMLAAIAAAEWARGGDGVAAATGP
jgi:hypothetical protein